MTPNLNVAAIGTESHPIIPGLTASRRRLIQGTAPVIAAIATLYGVASETTSTLWVNLAMAVVSAGVALPNVQQSSPLRKWLYGLTPAVSALAVGFGVTSGAQAALWVTLATVVLSGGVAFPATTDIPDPDVLRLPQPPVFDAETAD